MKILDQRLIEPNPVSPRSSGSIYLDSVFAVTLQNTIKQISICLFFSLIHSTISLAMAMSARGSKAAHSLNFYSKISPLGRDSCYWPYFPQNHPLRVWKSTDHSDNFSLIFEGEGGTFNLRSWDKRGSERPMGLHRLAGLTSSVAEFRPVEKCSLFLFPGFHCFCTPLEFKLCPIAPFSVIPFMTLTFHI